MSGLPPWARVRAARRGHIERVAALVAHWADALAVTPAERARWIRAAYLHDALKDAPVEVLVPHLPEGWGHTELAHGPAAAARARQDGESDQGILDAVAFHSVGFARWDAAGRMLYLADYLEPGRRKGRAERAALAARVPEDPEAILAIVAAARLGWVITSGWPLLPETVDFWNGLARRA